MISVIIPLYNKARTIKQTIQTVLNQKFQDFEIIVVNDGSTDNSYDVVKQIQHKKIRLYNKINEGVSATRNFAVQQANGEIIAFLDADDLWNESYLEEVAYMAQAFPACGMFVQNKKTISYNENENYTFPKSQQHKYRLIKAWEKEVLKLNYITSSIAMKKDLFIRLHGFDSQLTHGEDFDLWLRAGLSMPVVYSTKTNVLILHFNDNYNTSNLPKQMQKHAIYKIINSPQKYLNIKDNKYVHNVISNYLLNNTMLYFREKKYIEVNILIKHIKPTSLTVKNLVKYLYIIYFLKK